MEYSTNTKSELSYQEIDLDQVVNSIADDLKFYDNADKVKLIKSYSENTLIKTDIKRLNIILSNLITNSIKYHNYDQENPYLEIKASVIEDTIEIKVSDNGIGIDQEHQQQIFDMFYRATENGEGSGLGLYIVKDTVDLLNGEIFVESEINQGTTFTVRIPQK